MELGTYRLAEINKGGGLRQKAVGRATQYLNGVGAWVDMPTSMTPKAHSHSIPDLYCGVPNIVPGRILISGEDASSNPTWLDVGTNGQILGWTSDAPAWVDAPSGGSSVTAANPTASVGLAAVNGSATTFMRSDAAPKLDVSIAPTWTGNHTFSGYCEFNGGTNLAASGRARNIRFMTASGVIDHTSGTDTLIIASNTTSAAAMQLPTTATAGDRIELYSTSTRGATDSRAYFTCSSALIWPVAFQDPDNPVQVSSWGAGIYSPGYLFAIWDGSYWRVGYLGVQY